MRRHLLAAHVWLPSMGVAFDPQVIPSVALEGWQKGGAEGRI